MTAPEPPDAYRPQRAVRNQWARLLILAAACLVAGGALGAALTPDSAPRQVTWTSPTVRVTAFVPVTVTPAPVTVTASAAPAPTVTRTVTRPGPTVTRTITHTVTASASPAPEVTP